MNNIKKIIGLVAAGVLVIGGFFIVTADKKSVDDTVGDIPLPESSPEKQTASVAVNAPVVKSTVMVKGAKTVYKDGTYTAVGQYQSPAGMEQVTVTLAITGDTIVDASVVASSENKKSQQYMQKFVGGYKQYVTGKSVDSVSLEAVSGSSLTPEGFNAALAKIKVQAKA